MEIRLTVAADMLHSTVVPLVHAEVAQSTDATVAVGVRSTEAKARPLSVAVSPAEEGALPPPTLTKLTAGAAETRERATVGNSQKHRSHDQRLKQHRM